MQVESNASRPIDTGGADPGGASAVAAAARLRQQLPFVRRDAHAIEPSPRKGSLLSLVGRRHLRVFARAHERHAALTGAAGSPRWLSALSRLRFGGSSFLSRLRRATGNAHTPSAQATSGPTATGAAASADTQALERLTSSLQQRFAARAADRQGFHALLAQAFGDGYDTARAETIRLQTLAGDFSWMPSIRVADARALTDTSGTQGEGVVLGAYVAATDTIYVSRELLGDAERAGRLLTEELGHALDARLNARDAAGDEGEIFSRLVHDGQLDASELAALRAENDHGLVTIDGRSVSVEYGFFSKIKRALKKGIKSVTKSIVKGAVDLTRGSLQMTTGALTLNLDRVREGAKTSADAVQDTGKAVFKAVKETDKELRAIAKEALHKLMQSKWFAVILTICRFIPIPIVQLAVRVIDLVRAAYMVYQGVKNRSLSVVFGGVASLAGGAGQLAGALGASASTVSTIGSVATAANNLSMAYNAVAQKDLGAALGLLAGQAGQAGAPGAVAGYAQYAQHAYGVARAARDGDVLGAIGNGLSLAGSGVDGADPALAQLGDVVTGLRVAQQIERGNLDAAHGLASSMQVAQQARSEADSLAAQQRAQVAEGGVESEPALDNAVQGSSGETTDAPEGNRSAEASAPATALHGVDLPAPSIVTVQSGQTLESIARSRYGDQWRAGVTQLILENQIALNQWGSPVLRVGQGLTASDLPVDSQRLDALARAGGSIVANNSRGLVERAATEDHMRLADHQTVSVPALEDKQLDWGSMRTGAGRMESTVEIGVTTDPFSLVNHDYYVEHGPISRYYQNQVALFSDSNQPWYVRSVSFANATLAAPVMLIEEGGRGIMNVPYAGNQIGQHAAVFVQATDVDTRVIAGLNMVKFGSEGFVNAYAGSALGRQVYVQSQDEAVSFWLKRELQGDIRQFIDVYNSAVDGTRRIGYSFAGVEGYRAATTTKDALAGRYLSLERPLSPDDAVQKSALSPVWGNKAAELYEVTSRSGFYFKGQVAPQAGWYEGIHFNLSGGNTQVFMPYKNVDDRAIGPIISGKKIPYDH